MSDRIEFLDELERSLMQAIRTGTGDAGLQPPASRPRPVRRWLPAASAAVVLGAAALAVGTVVDFDGSKRPAQVATGSGTPATFPPGPAQAGHPEAGGSWRTAAPAVADRGSQLLPDVFWTGSRVLILHGSTSDDDVMSVELFDPQTNTTRAARRSTLDWRAGHAAVWTGTELLVWGGDSGTGIRHAGGAYDPATDTWRPLPDAPGAPRGTWHVAVWTGTEMLVWGNGRDTGGYAYAPAANRWRPIAGAPIRPRARPAYAWTGTELVVWGGCDPSVSPQCDDRATGRDEFADGAAYSPASDSWRVIAASPLTPRDAPQAVWTGAEVVVWGGRVAPGAVGTYGAAYDPRSDRWRTIADGPLSPRAWHSAVWTGEAMVVWGGSRGPDPVGDGAAYRPSDDTWAALPPAPIAPRDRHRAAWTGTEMVVAGGHPPGPLAAYRPGW